MELREEIERILTENAKIITGMDMDGNGVIEHEMYDEEEVDHDTVKNVTDELIKLFSLHRVSKDTLIKKDEGDEVAVCPNCGHKKCYPTDDRNFFNCDECSNEF